MFNVYVHFRVCLFFCWAVHTSIFSSEILDAVNYNGLLYFILANLLTGAVNLRVNTLQSSQTESFAYLAAYLFTLNSIIYIMYLLKIKTKFWWNINNACEMFRRCVHRVRLFYSVKYCIALILAIACYMEFIFLINIEKPPFVYTGHCCCVNLLHYQ